MIFIVTYPFVAESVTQIDQYFRDVLVSSLFLSLTTADVLAVYRMCIHVTFWRWL